MADNPYNDLIEQMKTLGAPQPPPLSAQERIAQLPGQEAPKQGLLDQFIMGKLTEAAPTPGAEFENFFRSRYSPAQEFVSNFIRGATATGKGVEASNVREEALKEFQIFQKDKQAAEQAKMQTLSVLASLTANRERIASEEGLAKTQSQMKALELDWDQTKFIHKGKADAIMAQAELRGKGEVSENIKATIKHNEDRLALEERKHEENPSALGYGLHFFRLKNGRRPNTPEEWSQVEQHTIDTKRALTEAGRPAARQILPAELQAGAMLFQQTGDPAILEKLGPEGKATVLANVVANGEIIGYRSENYRKQVAPVISGLSAYKDHADLVVVAKGIAAGIPRGATQEEREAIGLELARKEQNGERGFFTNKVQGYLSRLQGTIGAEAISSVIAAVEPALATKMAKAFGEDRVTDRDAERFIQILVGRPDLMEAIQAKIEFMQRRFYGELDTAIGGLVNFSQISDPDAEAIRFEDIEFELSSYNQTEKAKGRGAVDVETFMRKVKEAGGRFE